MWLEVQPQFYRIVMDIEEQTINQSLTAFSVEAWVSPDCGGVIASKEGLFSLRMGSVNQPAPASFSVQLPNGLAYISAHSKLPN